MKKIITLLFLLLIFNGFSQEKKLKEYSHTEFFKMIAAEKDSVFKLKDAFIAFKEQDSAFTYKYVDGQIKFGTNDTIVINKEIDLENVHFEHVKGDSGQALPYIIFNKKVKIYDATSIIFYYCVFNDDLELDTSVLGNGKITALSQKYENYEADIGFWDSSFNKNVLIDVGSIENYSSISFNLFYSDFFSKKERFDYHVHTNNIRETHFDENLFTGIGYLDFGADTSTFTSVYGNNFGDFRVSFTKASFNDTDVYIVEKNTFNKELLVYIDQFVMTHVYRWTQWKEKVLSAGGYDLYLKHLMEQDTSLDYDEIYKVDTIFNNYKNKYKFEYENSYKFEMQLLGQFYDFYKLQHDADYSNQVYVEFKNLETKRYAYLYKEHPAFNTFFTWKINQFLKVFSGYGTNPSLSIIFSLYVIFIFAFVYMLFPNNWETGKKNKLMNRLQFFTKYFRQDEGIREIYEEERQHDIMSYTEFRDYMHHSKKEIPNFFIWLARPIYYFSSYNYKMTGRVLRHTDILKGRWVDLPKRKKLVTSFIIGSWMLALILLDILIKFFNALTLSINTFTTLGFGEIPIKGIPRYLAVIQGFIGWFMLTIFSVSLISQLLN
tara:strand:+ start:3705 stop:5516 length:1812 start_codon:yes stop_codon:yes gene_type:complete